MLEIHDLEFEVVFFAQTLCNAILHFDKFFFSFFEEENLFLELLPECADSKDIEVAEFIDPERDYVRVEDDIIIWAAPCAFLPRGKARNSCTPLSSSCLFLLFFLCSPFFFAGVGLKSLVECFIGLLVDETDDLLLVIADLALAENDNLVLELEELLDELVPFALQFGYIKADFLLDLRPHSFFQP